MAKQPVTYTAPHAVYVDSTLRRAGEPFTTSEPKGEKWEKVGEAEKVAIEASDKLLDVQPSLEDLDLAALKAMAAAKNVPTARLDKKELITAIKAVDEPKL
jgi:hypothetical protein